MFGLNSSSKAHLLSRMELFPQMMCLLSGCLPHISYLHWRITWATSLAGITGKHGNYFGSIHWWVNENSARLVWACITGFASLSNTGCQRGHRMKDHPPPLYMPKDLRCWNYFHDNFRGWACWRNNWRLSLLMQASSHVSKAGQK